MSKRKKRPQPTPQPYRELCVSCCECGTSMHYCPDCAEAARRGEWVMSDQPREITDHGKVLTPGRVVSLANGRVGIQFVERTYQ